MSRGRARAPASKQRPKTGSGGGAGRATLTPPPGLLGLGPAVGNRAMGQLLDPKSGSLELAGTSNVPAPFLTRVAGGMALTVYFAKDHFVLDAANLDAVEALAAELPFLIEPRLHVDGHASGEGKDKHNQSLSERRRELVIALLTRDLEPRPDPSGSAKGESELVSEESGKGDELEANRARNRRVEILVLHQAPKEVPKEEKPKPSLFPKIELKPETPEERLNRRIKEGPPPPIERKKRSLKDLTDSALNNFLDDALKAVGVKDPKFREPIRNQLRGAILSGAGEALDTAIDTAPIDSEAKDALKAAIRAGAQQDL